VKPYVVEKSIGYLDKSLRGWKGLPRFPDALVLAATSIFRDKNNSACYDLMTYPIVTREKTIQTNDNRLGDIIEEIGGKSYVKIEIIVPRRSALPENLTEYIEIDKALLTKDILKNKYLIIMTSKGWETEKTSDTEAVTSLSTGHNQKIIVTDWFGFFTGFDIVKLLRFTKVFAKQFIKKVGLQHTTIEPEGSHSGAPTGGLFTFSDYKTEYDPLDKVVTATLMNRFWNAGPENITQVSSWPKILKAVDEIKKSTLGGSQ
jgi:hypothetical protein